MTTTTAARPYTLDLSGECLYYGADAVDGELRPLSAEQLAAVTQALLAPHPSGEASGVLSVATLANAEASLILQLTIDPRVFVGEDAWSDALEHVRDMARCGETLTPEDTALETYCYDGPLIELGDIVKNVLGRDWDFTVDSSTQYAPVAEWKLYWVQDQHEVYAARSLEEARAHVEAQIGEPVSDDEIGEVMDDMEGPDGEGGSTTLFAAFQQVQHRLTEPMQIWSACS